MTMTAHTLAPTAVGSGAASLVAKIILPAIAAGLGAVLLAVPARELAPLAAVVPLTLLALALCWTFARGRVRATAAGMAMFGTCLLVAGVSHVYQHEFFGSVLNSHAEVLLWYNHAADGFVDDILFVNAPFALMTWRAAYEVAAWLGLGNGTWIAIAVNACLMAISATLIVRTAGIFFDHDPRRIRFVVTLTVLCPTFWMFGGMLVRDSFALLVQTTVIFVAIQVMTQRLTFWRLVKYGALLGLAAWATTGIRAEMIYTLPVTAAIVAVALGLQGRGLRRPVPIIAALLLVGIAGLQLVDQFVGTIGAAQQGYSNILTNYDFAESGLGNRLVVSQPLPIRVVVGTLYLHVFPIPFWYGFNVANWDYHWLKSFSAVFMIGLTPLAALGAWRAIAAALAGKRGTAPFCFAALYWLAMAAAVAATSLETRHLGQFMPMFIFLAAMPDLALPSDRQLFRWLGGLWYGGIAAGHVLWLLVT